MHSILFSDTTLVLCVSIVMSKFESLRLKFFRVHTFPIKPMKNLLKFVKLIWSQILTNGSDRAVQNKKRFQLIYIKLVLYSASLTTYNKKNISILPLIGWHHCYHGNHPLLLWSDESMNVWFEYFILLKRLYLMELHAWVHYTGHVWYYCSYW